MERSASIARVEARLGHSFDNPELLELALSHRSWCAEQQVPMSNERIEFLGDSVLGLAVTRNLFDTYPELAEGKLARMRAALVNTQTLAAVAGDLDLGEVILLGKGEARSGGRKKASILADCMEAVIGAVYLDAGLDVATELVLRLLDPHVERAAQLAAGDPKSRLQELAVKRSGTEPRYEICESGPAHERAFSAVVHVGAQQWGPGNGGSKKEAEQRAAEQALRDLADVGATRREPSNDGTARTRGVASGAGARARDEEDRLGRADEDQVAGRCEEERSDRAHAGGEDQRRGPLGVMAGSADRLWRRKRT